MDDYETDSSGTLLQGSVHDKDGTGLYKIDTAEELDDPVVSATQEAHSKWTGRFKTIGRKLKRQRAIRVDVHEPAEFSFRTLNIASHSRSIRLITLLPGDETDINIYCKISEASLDRNPSYEALSYARGERGLTLPVHISGRVQRVSATLHQALSRLRLSDRSRTLWVDELCIDQNYILEKGHQVRLIRDIYLGAEEVAVWLGEEGKETRLALDFCDFLVEFQEGHFPAMGSNLENGWSACEALFFKRPWWKSPWAIPEVCHNKPTNVYIGRLKFTIEHLYGIFKIYYDRLWLRNQYQSRLFIGQDKVEASFAIIMKHRSAFDSGLGQGDLSANLHWFRGRRAQDPRDQIFALSGMCPLRCGCGEIDYSLSKENLYTKCTIEFLKSDPSALLLVESVGRPVSRRDKLPSWVPDFSLEQPYLARAMFNISKQFGAGEGFPSCEGISQHLATGRQLQIPGITVATVTKIYRGQLEYFEPTGFLVATKLLSAKLFDFKRSPGMMVMSKTVSDAARRGRTKINETNTSWGPYGIEIGDIIVVAKDAPLPFVLRRHDNDLNHLFVGACVLINSPLESLSRGQIGALGALEGYPDKNPKLWADPGFSDIMFGSACSAAVGRLCQVQNFLID